MAMCDWPANPCDLPSSAPLALGSGLQLTLHIPSWFLQFSCMLSCFSFSGDRILDAVHILTHYVLHAEGATATTDPVFVDLRGAHGLLDLAVQLLTDATSSTLHRR